MKIAAALLALAGSASASAFVPTSLTRNRNKVLHVVTQPISGVCPSDGHRQLSSTYTRFNLALLLQHQVTTSLEVANLREFPGSTAPIPAFDPLDIANVGSDETFAWLQVV